IWNFKFNLKLAKAVKERYPDCKIIFGGHQISDTSEWLQKYPFIDFAVFGEGEIVISNILLALIGNGDFSSIPNIAYRNSEKIIETERESICGDINTFPSPYLNGIFDNIVQNGSDTFAAVIETTRGCPYHCAYCDWGDYNQPMRRFDIQRVKKEIEWLGKNSVVFVVFADSNFGFYDNDAEIIDELVRIKKKYGFPQAVEIAFAKLGSKDIFEMNKKLYENDMSRGATLSMQTLDKTSLKNIGRENMTPDRFTYYIDLYAKANIPFYTELILGLPGETYESFCKGVDYLLENGQHNSIHVFYCEVLPNAVMGQKEYIKKHGIELLKRDFVLRNGVNSEGVSGESNVIVATNTMSRDMLVKSMFYAFTVQVFHNFGLCRAIALYFHYEKKFSYYQFYNSLLDWLNERPERFTSRIFKKFYDRHRKSASGKDFDAYINPAFGDTQFNLSDGAFLELVNSCNEFYNDIIDFLSDLSGPDDIKGELLRFQKLIIRKPSNLEESETFSYNWACYYSSLMKNKKAILKNENIEIKVFSSPEYNDPVSFARQIAIKGRRIGKSIILNDPHGYEVRFITHKE
ncbi:MAG: B12-binding domain-containing radical SAM protein, partial [Acutalibacteraceae bacterium]